MKTIFDPRLQAQVSIDAANAIRHVRHRPGQGSSAATDLALSGDAADSPEQVAAKYLRTLAPALAIGEDQLQNLEQAAPALDPRAQGTEYRLSEVKRAFDSATVSFAQTHLNVPVWRRGVSVKVKGRDVIGATNNTDYGLQSEMPQPAIVEGARTLLEGFQQAQAGLTAGDDGRNELADLVRESLGSSGAAGDTPSDLSVLNGRLFVYRYDPDKRYAGKPAPPAQTESAGQTLEERAPRFLYLPPVSDRIQPGQAYLVTEIVFKATEGHEMVWLILVELETKSVLYAEPMTFGVNGLVFRRDPMVKTGDLTITSGKPNNVLNAHREPVLLNDLAAPAGGTQHLSGSFVRIEDVEPPPVVPPTMPAGGDFDYDARNNNFAAVNAYYHQTELFRTIASLGFDIATYFDGTTFPIRVDHRGFGNQINAHWSSNGRGGTDHMCYGLCDTTDTANPLGRAVDPWVHWHEMGGHGTLGDHVDSGVLGFAHSAGDGLAAVQMDPDSALRNVPERFRYAPFRPFTTERRFDRPVATWAWGAGSPNDDGDYGSEQILATCHFRVYRAIGGDHPDLARRRFASRAMTYLILRTIQNLTPQTNPDKPELWCEEMQVVDLEDWTSEGLIGGAYNKVVRWAFEKQGAYQPAGAPTPVTMAGAPPPVDVYIDDGRGGEYQFQLDHASNTSVWNRNAADGGSVHQDAIAGQSNFIFVKVKNRGTQAAANVTVKGYQNQPGANGRVWPSDFVEMAGQPALNVASIAPASGQEVVVGPFAWTPSPDARGGACVLLLASTAGDPSNVDHFAAGETIEDWRLVPNDNNIGQRAIVIATPAVA
ncbi:MAG: hypothetical protein WCE79_13530 [Xanthobacteraceae bacterium]